MVKDFEGKNSAESEETQKAMQEKIAPGDLPFDLTMELGEIFAAELKSPGVYFLVFRKEKSYREMYVVTADAPAISDKARSYGRQLSGHPGLRLRNVKVRGTGSTIKSQQSSVKREPVPRKLRKMCNPSLWCSIEAPQ